jgi:hypothetical protein
MKKIIYIIAFFVYGANVHASDFYLSEGIQPDVSLKPYIWECELTENLYKEIENKKIKVRKLDGHIADCVDESGKLKANVSIKELKINSDSRSKISKQVKLLLRLKQEVSSIEREQYLIRLQLYQLVVSDNAFSLYSERLTDELQGTTAYYVINESLRNMSQEDLTAERTKLKNRIKEIEEKIISMIEEESFPSDVPSIVKGCFDWEQLNEAYELKRSAAVQFRRGKSEEAMELVKDEYASLLKAFEETAYARSYVWGTTCINNFDKYGRLLRLWQSSRVQKAKIEAVMEMHKEKGASPVIP